MVVREVGLEGWGGADYDDDDEEEEVEEEDDDVEEYNHDYDNLDEGGDSLVVTIFMINVYDL